MPSNNITFYVAPMSWWRKLLSRFGLRPNGSKYRPFETIQHAVEVAHSYDFEQEIPISIKPRSEGIEPDAPLTLWD